MADTKQIILDALTIKGWQVDRFGDCVTKTIKTTISEQPALIWVKEGYCKETNTNYVSLTPSYSRGSTNEISSCLTFIFSTSREQVLTELSKCLESIDFIIDKTPAMKLSKLISS